MIKQINLYNWKSFSKAQFYIDPLTVLIGTNASGKSNILDALNFIQKISLGKQITSAINGDSSSEGVRGGIEWMIKRGKDCCRIEVIIGDTQNDLVEYSYSIEIGVIEDIRAEIVFESLKRIKLNRKNKEKKDYKNLYYTDNKDLRNPSITTYFSTGTQGRGKRIDLRRSFSILSQSQSLSLIKEVSTGIDMTLRNLTQIFVFDPIPSLMRNYSRLSEKLLRDGSNIAGVLAALDEKNKSDVEELLTKYLKKLPEKDISRVYTESVGKFGSDAMLYCEESWSKASELMTVDARGMSDGTLRFLAIMTALLTVKTGSLLVIEEIDNGLHPSRAYILVKFLNQIGRQRKVDIVCTTHNQALLNAFGNEMIPFISVVHRDKESGDSQIVLLEEIDHLPRLIARGKVGTLTSKGIIEEAVNQ